MEAVERKATSLRPAARLFVSPVGEACTVVTVGETQNGSFEIDLATRTAIEAPEPIEIGTSASFEILLSELDLRNRSCKFALKGEEDSDRRYVGEITDPILQIPGNPYSQALHGQRWLSVTGKPSIKDGELDRLFISDIAMR